MTKIFTIDKDHIVRPPGRIVGSHKWSLPGVSCPYCGAIWAATGLEYPAVDLSTMTGEQLYRKARSEPLDVYLELRKEVEDHISDSLLLRPGASFGPTRGKVTGSIDGFVWKAPWTICLGDDALRKLYNEGLSLPKSVTVEREDGQLVPAVHELHLPLRARLTNGVYDGVQPDYCRHCDRDSSSLPDHVVIDRRSVPNDVDIFRVTNFATLVLVTEKFVQAVERLNIRGAVFEEVNTN